jgi:RNA polymerase sigma factor (sigma-70 family)
MGGKSIFMLGPIRVSSSSIQGGADSLATTERRSSLAAPLALVDEYQGRGDEEEINGDAVAKSGLRTVRSERCEPSQQSAERFRQLMLPHLDAAYNLARYLSRGADGAEDIVQEPYLRAYRAFDSYQGGEARSWILAIIRNCFFDWVKNLQADKLSGRGRGQQTDLGFGASDLDPIADFMGPDRETPESALIGHDESSKVRSVIQTLPEPFREALVLRELEELSYKQIAEITAAPIGTVMSRLARARQMFAEAWRTLIDKTG